MEYCPQPIQDLDCNKVLECLNQQLNVLDPSPLTDMGSWVAMPINDKLLFILTNLAGLTISDVRNALSLTTIGTGVATYNSSTGVLNIPISTGGGGSLVETYSVTGSTFQKNFTQGSVLDSLFITTTSSISTDVSIGTTLGGNNIEEQLTVNNLSSDVFTYTKHFAQNTTWYFSNLPATCIITFIYKILI